MKLRNILVFLAFFNHSLAFAKDEIYNNSLYLTTTQKQISSCDTALRPILNKGFGADYSLIRDRDQYRLNVFAKNLDYYSGNIFNKMGNVTLGAKNVTMINSEYFPAENSTITKNPDKFIYGSYLTYNSFSVKPGGFKLRGKTCKVSMAFNFSFEPNSLRSQPVTGGMQIICPHLRKRTCSISLSGDTNYGYL